MESGNGGRAELAVVGVGGAGVNAVAHLRDVGLPGVRFVAADTSAPTLARAAGVAGIRLGRTPGGHGTGGDRGLGAAAARLAEPEVRAALGSADLAFIVAGLAGGTGGGAAPEVARAARRAGAVVVGFGIAPFGFEARRRAEAAEDALVDFREACDTTIVLDNRRAQALAGDRVTLDVALRLADDVVRQAVHGLGAMVSGQGWINVDLPMVRAALASGGDGCLALGLGRGADPALAAMRAALASPLADMAALARARSVLVEVTGGSDLALADAADAMDLLQGRLAPGCRVAAGAGYDPSLAGAAQVVILANGVGAAARDLIAWPGRRSDRWSEALAHATPALREVV